MNITDLKFTDIIGLAAVLLLLLGIYNTVMTATKNHIEAKKQRNAPVDALNEKLGNHARMLDNDKRRFEEYDRRLADIERRFDEIDARLTAMKRESSMTLRGVRSLMSHEISGNSIDKLQKSAEQIDEFLMDKVDKE